MPQEPDPFFRALFIKNRQDEAYKKSPTGTWLQKLLPTFCKHPKIRCIHGDEIIQRKFRRRLCMVCGRALKGDLPIECFFTGEPHPNVEN